MLSVILYVCCTVFMYVILLSVCMHVILSDCYTVFLLYFMSVTLSVCNTVRLLYCLSVCYTVYTVLYP